MLRPLARRLDVIERAAALPGDQPPRRRAARRGRGAGRGGCDHARHRRADARARPGTAVGRGDRRDPPRGPGRAAARHDARASRTTSSTCCASAARSPRPVLIDDLRAAAQDEWTAFTRHPFVLALRDGTLPPAAFRTYLVQDYRFLVHFARAHALAVLKADTLADMRAAARGIAAILDQEMDLHVRYCAGWGISPAELEATPEEHPANVAYTRFVLDAGIAGDALDLARRAGAVHGRVRRHRPRAGRGSGHRSRRREPLRGLDRDVLRRRVPRGRRRGDRCSSTGCSSDAAARPAWSRWWRCSSAPRARDGLLADRARGLRWILASASVACAGASTARGIAGQGGTLSDPRAGAVAIPASPTKYGLKGSQERPDARTRRGAAREMHVKPLIRPRRRRARSGSRSTAPASASACVRGS